MINAQSANKGKRMPIKRSKKDMLNIPTEIFFYKTILSVIILSFLFALFTSVFHYLSPAPDNIDLILPPIMTLVFYPLLLLCLLNPYVTLK